MLEEGRSADLQRLWGWGRTVASATLQLVHSFSAWFCFQVVGGQLSTQPSGRVYFREKGGKWMNEKEANLGIRVQ